MTVYIVDTPRQLFKLACPNDDNQDNWYQDIYVNGHWEFNDYVGVETVNDLLMDTSNFIYERII